VLGDGQLGQQGLDPDARAVEQENLAAQDQIRNTLVNEAYVNSSATQRPVDKD
jgi:hypothetical protein